MALLALTATALLIWGTVGNPTSTGDTDLSTSTERDVLTLLDEIELWQQRLEEALRSLEQVADAATLEPILAATLDRATEGWPAGASIEQWRDGFPIAWTGRPAETPSRLRIGLARVGSVWALNRHRVATNGDVLWATVPIRSLWFDLHPLALTQAALDSTQLTAIDRWWIAEATDPTPGTVSRKIRGLAADRYLVFDLPAPERLESRRHEVEVSWRHRRWAIGALLLCLATLLVSARASVRPAARWAVAVAATFALRVAWAHLGAESLPWPAAALDEGLFHSDRLVRFFGPAWESLRSALAFDRWLARPAEIWLTCLTVGAVGLITLRWGHETRIIGTRFARLFPGVGFLLGALATGCLRLATTTVVLDSQLDLLRPVADPTLGPRVLLLTGLFFVGIGLAATLATVLVLATRARSLSSRRAGQLRAGLLFGLVVGAVWGGSWTQVVSALGLGGWAFTLATPIFRRGGLVLPAAAILGTLAITPGLEASLERSQRQRVADIAAMRPDPEIAFRDALESLVTEGTTAPKVQQVVERGGTDDQVAFAIWATSPFGREGWPALVRWSGPGGVVGDFEIGLPQTNERPDHGPVDLPWPLPGENAQVEPRQWVDSQGRSWWVARYSGNDQQIEVHAPFSREPTPFGSRGLDRLDEEAIRVTVLGGRDPTRYETPPATLVPPDGLSELPVDGPGLWADQPIGGRDTRCYFARRSRPDRQIAVTVRSPDILSRARDAASLLALFSSLVALPGLGLALIRRRHGRTLESRILISTVFVSLLPIGGIAWLESGYSREDLRRQLEIEADQLFAQLDRAVEIVPIGVDDVSTDWCLGLAQLLGTPVSVYRQGRLIASSVPALDALELVPQRLPGRTYELMEHNGLAEHLSLVPFGSEQVWTTFRRTENLTGEPGDVIGLTLGETRASFGREQQRQLAFSLMGLFVAILAIWIVAVLLARRLSAPLRRLQWGTELVATGDLSLRLDERHEGQEISDLVRAFNTMTAELERSRERQLRAQREAAWREMARQIAHDIKNSLTPMKLSVQHLQRVLNDQRLPLDPTVQRAGRHLLAEIDALAHIADSFGDIARAARPSRLPRETVDLQALIDDVVALFAPTCARDAITLESEVDPHLPPIDSESAGIRRVLNNLLTNAVQAFEAHDGEQRIRVTARVIEQAIELRIEDSGPGISPEVLPYLFEPRFSTKTSGSGLGLAICRSILADLGGSIEAISGPSGGATFVIRLPLEIEEGRTS